MMLHIGPLLIVTKHTFYEQIVRHWEECKAVYIKESMPETELQKRQDYEMATMELLRRFLFR